MCKTRRVSELTQKTRKTNSKKILDCFKNCFWTAQINFRSIFFYFLYLWLMGWGMSCYECLSWLPVSHLFSTFFITLFVKFLSVFFSYAFWYRPAVLFSCTWSFNINIIQNLVFCGFFMTLSMNPCLSLSPCYFLSI